MRIAIIGAGSVGATLGQAWLTHGEDVSWGVRNPADPKYAALGKARLKAPGEAANLISMEIGGTSCDVMVMAKGEVRVADELTIDGYHLTTPSVEIHTVGAGGGSIAWRDPGGVLHVGPQSAGARPGPACYGRGGTEPTVTETRCQCLGDSTCTFEMTWQ